MYSGMYKVRDDILSKKYTFEKVKNIIETQSECKLLSTEYKNSKEKMLFICKCGEVFETCLYSFLYRNKRQCRECSNDKLRMERKRDISQIVEFINNNTNCIFLELPNGYKNQYSPIKLQCVCGQIFTTTVEKLYHRNKHQCNNCSMKILSNKKSYSKEFIKDFIKENSSCIFVSMDENNKINLQCNCGQIFTTTFSKFKSQNKRQCNKCSFDDKRERFAHSYKYIKEYIENNGCVLTTKEYINSSLPLDIICSCGITFTATFDSFKFNKQHRCYSCSAKTSLGEATVRNVLSEIGARYKEQYRINVNQSRMYMDFVVFNSDSTILYFIEYDGEQHFKPIDFFGGEDGFKETTRRDKIKNEYCMEKKIPLLRIPYTEFHNIKEIVSDFHSRFFNA